MSGFQDSFAKAEQALMQHRRAKPAAKSKAGADLFKAAVDAKASSTPKAANDDYVTVNGIKIPSVDYMDERERKLRDDLNEALDGIETAAPIERTLTVQLPDLTELGKQTGMFHKCYETLIKAMHVRDAKGNRKNIMIAGPMGGGKTFSGKQAASLFDLSFDYIGQTNMPHDVMGYVHPTLGEYIWTAFTKSYVNGGVVYLEEMDSWSPNATLCINAPLANGYITLPDGTQHERHPDCIIVACTNTWGTGPTAEYVGRNKLDNAFLDRFGIKMDWPYDEELERAAAADDDVVTAVQTARYNAERYGIRIPISPRSSIDVADMVRSGFTMEEAFDLNFLASADKDQRKMLLEDVIL